MYSVMLEVPDAVSLECPAMLAYALRNRHAWVKIMEVFVRSHWLPYLTFLCSSQRADERMEQSPSNGAAPLQPPFPWASERSPCSWSIEARTREVSFVRWLGMTLKAFPKAKHKNELEVEKGVRLTVQNWLIEWCVCAAVLEGWGYWKYLKGVSSIRN